MTQHPTYAPGQLIWADLSTPDLDASAAFYGALLGWTAEPPQEQFGGYASYLLDGRPVVGVMPLMAPEQPPTWTCYVCTDDADETAALVTGAGGTVLAPPMDVADLGRMAVFAEPSGAVFGVWQPGRHRGAEVVDEDGAMTWCELTTRDLPASTAFYGEVFGWSEKASPEYTELQLDGTSVAGAMAMPEAVPAEVPPSWMPYFMVADPAAGAEQVRALGGTVLVGPGSYPGGEYVVVQDPHGATFGMLRPTGS